MNKPIDNMGKPMYGVIDSGLFGVRVVSGIVTGLRFTEDKPQYEISFGKNSWWTTQITDKVEEIGKFFNLASIDRIKDTHGLKIKYEL